MAALLLPWLFFDWSTHRHSGFALTMLSEIGLMSVFALSFNMQMGQAGLLSFGHAILFGLGGYVAAHTLNAIKAGTMWLPVELVPLAGGLGGLVFGALFGYVATQQRATAFAMITMGLGELVAACALMFMAFFGGEGGISTDRVTGTSMLGVSYSSSWEVYCLVVVWTAIATVAMRLQTQTPLGRMANAARDNFERAQFVGYDPRMVRFYQFTLSGFFAGIGGGLYAIVYEIVTFDTVAASKSATALLATYIGGAGGFFGPLLGTHRRRPAAERRQPAQQRLAALCRRAVHRHGDVCPRRACRHHRPARADRPDGRLRELVVPYARILVPGVLSVFGFVLLIELASFTTIGVAQGKAFKIGFHAVDPATAFPWLLGAAALIGGGAWLRLRGPRVSHPLGCVDRRCQGKRGDAVSDVAISLRDVRKSFGRTEIIRGVDLDIPRGQRHAMIGPNGAGKTTLFNLISGRFPLTSGTIALNGRSIAGLAPHEINRLGLSRSFQITSIFPRLTVFENIRCGLLWARGYRYSFWHLLGGQRALNEETDMLIERLNLQGRRNVPAGLLSYAEQRALEVGITVAGGADIILLDEPTAGMSHSETEYAVALIRAVSEGKTLLIVEHDMSVVFGLADVITVLVYGEVIASDVPARIRGDKAVQEAYLGTEAA